MPIRYGFDFDKVDYLTDLFKRSDQQDGASPADAMDALEQLKREAQRSPKEYKLARKWFNRLYAKRKERNGRQGSA